MITPLDEDKIISELFPNYKKKKQSRFNKFFKLISSSTNFNQSVVLNKRDIITHKDLRTSLVIKCIPSNVTRDDFLELLNLFTHNINFIYFPEQLLFKYDIVL